MAKTKAEIQRDYEKRTGYAAQNKYIKERTRSIAIRFMLSTESDLLDYIDTKPNKAGYIKDLIRKDMENENNG